LTNYYHFKPLKVARALVVTKEMNVLSSGIHVPFKFAESCKLVPASLPPCKSCKDYRQIEELLLGVRPQVFGKETIRTFKESKEGKPCGGEHQNVAHHSNKTPRSYVSRIKSAKTRIGGLVAVRHSGRTETSATRIPSSPYRGEYGHARKKRKKGQQGRATSTAKPIIQQR